MDIPSVLSPAAVIEILDGLACALLAAAAACRARGFGGNLAGAIVLGIICGLLPALLRETLLYGSPASRMVLNTMPDDACMGALAGAIMPTMLPKHKARIFFWLDSLGMGLATSLAASLALPGAGIAGALALGLCAGLAPGLCRDAALGDIAMFVERGWYAASALLGGMLALALPVALMLGPENIFSRRSAEIGILAGMCLCAGLRAWKDRAIVE